MMLGCPRPMNGPLRTKNGPANGPKNGPESGPTKAIKKYTPDIHALRVTALTVTLL